MAKTVVVGGGTSGLAAAYTLEKAGVECTVLEKEDYSGGRIYGVVREGYTLDLGAQFFFTRYRSTIDIIKKLGIEDQLVWFKPSLGILRDGTVQVINTDIKYNLIHPTAAFKFRPLSNWGMRRGPKLGIKLLALRKKLDFDDPLKAIELDNISTAEYAKRYFGDEILEYIVQPVVSALTLGEPEEVSAAYGLGLILYAMGRLGTLKNGIGFLAESMAKNISDLKLETSVTRIVLEDKKVKGVEVGTGKKKEFIEADNVICCTTGTVAAKILGDLPQKMTDILADIKYSSCVHVMFAVPSKPLGDIFGVATPRREGLCMPGFVENSNKFSAYAPPGTGIMHTFSFGEFSREMMELDDDKIRERMIQELQMVVPRFPDEPIFCEIFRWPEAVGLCGPGQITSVQRLKVDAGNYKGLHLAGAYLGMPSVEAAIHYGVQAAERVLKS
ncbi:MAG: FAD-dependent oxidoreductase [Actinobacteria bacterium]|nr:FAD-dependent oxidoreductase [Actinomycetota bacterium]